MKINISDFISEREKNLPKSEFEKILKIAVERKDIISLGPGEPDFITPKDIREHTKKSLDKGMTHYSTIEGMSSLRNEISKKLKKENGVDADADENILVTTGSTEALFLSSMSLIEQGDKMIVPDPGYMDYIPLADLMGGSPLPMNIRNIEEEIEKMKKNWDDKTHAMILNSPSNPTGKVLKKKDLERIVDFANEKNIIIISDEAYESFTYGENKHISIASLNGMENRTVSLFTFSKSYAMAGYRIGYATGPKEIIGAMRRMKIYSTISSPVFVQESALYALEHCGKEIERMKKEYERRGKMMHRRLGEIGMFQCNSPEGAFYMFPSIEEFKMKSVDLAHRILEEAKVLVVPGTEFGHNGEGYIRMSYATSYEKIQEAMDRIETWTRSLA